MNEETKVVDVDVEDVETIEVEMVEESKLGKFKSDSKKVWKKIKPFVFTGLGVGLVTVVGMKVLDKKSNDDELEFEDSNDDYETESIEMDYADEAEPVTFIEETE